MSRPLTKHEHEGSGGVAIGALEASPPGVLEISRLPGGAGVLHDLASGAKPVLVREAIAFLASGPTIRRGREREAAHRLWERVRGVEYARGRTLEAALSIPEIASPATMLVNLLRVLLDAGTLRQTLERERGRIDAALRLLGGAQ